jgi:aminoglycoside phosphotransferase
MTALAHDRALPQRDLLLDGRRAGEVIARQLGRSAPVDSCEVVRVKYRIGESLRVRYRVDAGGRSHDVACRTFADGAAEAAHRRALQRALPVSCLRSVGWAPELETVFWTFPNDRKLSLDLLQGAASNRLADLIGSRPRTFQLMAYAPEKSATVRWDGGDGPLAFAKHYSGARATRSKTVHEAIAASGIRVPRSLGSSSALRTLVVEALPGVPLAAVSGAGLEVGYRLLGSAVAALHQLPPLDDEVFSRLEPLRVRAAAELIGRARPDSAATAEALAAALERRSAEANGNSVCLHGDLHAKNVLLEDGRVALVDLDQVAAGPAAAEIGSMLASLRYATIADGFSAAYARAHAAAFLDGYADVQPLPSATATRWHTAAALLVERALRAVNRMRPNGLRHLQPLLADAWMVLDA